MHYKHLLLSAAIKDSKGKTINYTDFIKKNTILDAIRLCDKAWDAVPQSAMYGVWNKLLGRAPGPLKSDLLQTEKLSEIVQMGKELGFDSDINVNDVRAELDVKHDVLSVEDVVEIDNNSNDTEPTDNYVIVVESEKKLKKETVENALQLIDQACAMLSEQDPNYERSSLFNQQIQSHTNMYREWLDKHRRTHSKQQSLNNYFTRDK